MKKYIRPSIIAKKIYFRSLLADTSNITVDGNELFSGEGCAKRGNFDDSYEDDYPGNSPHNIDLWADEVERDMAYGH